MLISEIFGELHLYLYNDNPGSFSIISVIITIQILNEAISFPCCNQNYNHSVEMITTLFSEERRSMKRNIKTILTLRRTIIKYTYNKATLYKKSDTIKNSHPRYRTYFWHNIIFQKSNFLCGADFLKISLVLKLRLLHRSSRNSITRSNFMTKNWCHGCRLLHRNLMAI